MKPTTLLATIILAGLLTTGLASQDKRVFDLDSAQLYFTQGRVAIPVKQLTIAQLQSWFGIEPRKQDIYAIFETGLPDEMLAITPGKLHLELQGLAYFTVRSGGIELAMGMDKKLVTTLLGEPSSSSKGTLEYLMWSSIGPDFRLGFDNQGALFSIRF